MTRTYASIICLLVCLIVASHVRYHWVDGVKDSWPLSWYPMFRNPRPEEEVVFYMAARDWRGEVHHLSYKYWARGGFNQGRNQLRRIVEMGPERAMQTCEEVAAKVARDGIPEQVAVTEVAVLVATWDRDTFFLEGKRVPEEVGSAARCAVPSGEADP